MAGLEGPDECGLVHDGPPGNVDEDGSLLHGRELPLADEPCGLVRVGHDEDDKVRLAKHGFEVGPRVELRDIDGPWIDALGVAFRSDDLHPHAAAQPRHLSADPA